MKLSKPLTANEVKALTHYKKSNKLTWGQIAQSCGTSERQLARLLRGSTTRNSEKGRAVRDKIDAFIVSVKEVPTVTNTKGGRKKAQLLPSKTIASIIHYRDAMHMTNMELALSLGVRWEYISRLLSGTTKVSDALTQKIQKWLDQTAEVPVLHPVDVMVLQPEEEARFLTDEEIGTLQNTQTHRKWTLQELADNFQLHDHELLNLMQKRSRIYPEYFVKTFGTKLDEWKIHRAPSVELETHSFRLRRDLSLTFDLPSDLTAEEADKIAQFIKLMVF